MFNLQLEHWHARHKKECKLLRKGKMERNSKESGPIRNGKRVDDRELKAMEDMTEDWYHLLGIKLSELSFKINGKLRFTGVIIREENRLNSMFVHQMFHSTNFVVRQPSSTKTFFLSFVPDPNVLGGFMLNEISKKEAEKIANRCLSKWGKKGAEISEMRRVIFEGDESKAEQDFWPTYKPRPFDVFDDKGKSFTVTPMNSYRQQGH